MFQSKSVVLEYGFGQGHFLREATAMGLRVIGIDRDDRLVHRARDSGYDVHVGDIRDPLPFLEHVDGILAAHLIEHLHPDEVADFLRRASDYVRPGGSVILSTPNMGDWRVATGLFWEDPTHVRPYPPGAVAQLADPALWRWDGDGFEPTVFTRRTPFEVLNRLRLGREFGRPSRWYRLRRM